VTQPVVLARCLEAIWKAALAPHTFVMPFLLSWTTWLHDHVSWPAYTHPQIVVALRSHAPTSPVDAKLLAAASVPAAEHVGFYQCDARAANRSDVRPGLGLPGLRTRVLKGSLAPPQVLLLTTRAVLGCAWHAACLATGSQRVPRETGVPLAVATS